jgi:predicted enzyme related to lactoylglutathione lyase
MASKKTVPTRAIKKTVSKKPATKNKTASKPAAKASAKPAKASRVAAPAAKAPRAAAPAAKAPRAAAPAAKAKAEKRSNAVVHWEIQSTQPEVLHEFYSDVFGWKIDANNPMNYGMVASKGANGGIDGGIGGTQGDMTARVVVYASVSSIPPILKRIEARGGKTIMPRTDIGPVVMAIYLDPEGNTMGLIEDR